MAKWIKEKFKQQDKTNPYLSTYMIFLRVITWLKISRKRLIKLLDELVDKEDYDQKDKNDIIKHLKSFLYKGKFTAKKAWNYSIERLNGLKGSKYTPRHKFI